MLQAKIVSSLEKCFKDTDLEKTPSFGRSFIYRNQRISLQIAMKNPGHGQEFAEIACSGLPAECVSFRQVGYIWSDMPCWPGTEEPGYVRTEAGFFPDLLSPLEHGMAKITGSSVSCVWVDIDFSMFPARNRPRKGKIIPVCFEIRHHNGPVSLEFELEYIPEDLPEQELILTQWFHCDCIANYYGETPWSERHWKLVENFAATAVRNGINALLTPVFTPPLDTHVGGERLTTQLVKVKKCANGRYIFGFDLLDRWIDMCDRVGIRYFEISHLFTQWGAAHAPKVMAETPEGYRRIFGWDTDASGPEYSRFLKRFLTAFISHMKARGDDSRCLFHISDEPHADQLGQYKKSRRIVKNILSGYTVMDALSDVRFYKSGAVTTPIPSTDHIEPFIEEFSREGRSGLWTYYCCGQTKGVSNRMFGMSGARTRFIGFQLWKYGIAGFLQWGYNFYNNCGSYDPINPYLDSNGSGWVPSGDTYSVYPGMDGSCLESVRINQFREALDDMRALRLCESLIGRERTLSEAEKICGEIVFSKCVCCTEEMLALRSHIDSLVAEAAGKRRKNP